MKRIVVVSDLHFGSIYGLLPPGYENTDGCLIGQNKGQKYLWECFTDFCDRVAQFNPDAVIVNGDIVEGTQRKQSGAELSLRMMTDQKKAAVVGLTLLKKAAKGAPHFYVQGTQYHVGENGEYEESIALEMKASKYFSLGSGDLVKEVLWLDVDGVLIEAAHHVGGTSGLYRGTSLDREMQWSAMAGKDASKGVPKADLLIRSHVHNFVAEEHGSKQGVITPCWQLQTQYARKKSVHRMHPDIGGLLIEVDPAAKKLGEAPCKIRKQLYALPAVPITKL